MMPMAIDIFKREHGDGNADYHHDHDDHNDDHDARDNCDAVAGDYG